VSPRQIRFHSQTPELSQTRCSEHPRGIEPASGGEGRTAGGGQVRAGQIGAMS